MKIGMYSITYRGVWYQGEALDILTMMQLAKKQGWEGIELDAERPHASPMDVSADDRIKLRGLSEELELPISAISPNCDFSSPVPVQREAMISYVRDCIKLAPDIVNDYKDVLALIEDVGSPALKGCMDINIEPDAESAENAREMVKASGKLLVHSHFNAEFARDADGSVDLVAGGYFDERFWERRVAYPAYVEALVASGYDGYMDWEFCHPAMENGKPAGIDYVHTQTQLALEYMKDLRAKSSKESQT